MEDMSDWSAAWAHLLSNEEFESVPGLPEWIAMEQWRANWRPEADMRCGSDELSVLFQRVLRQGYVAYLEGARAMPELFARDSSLASMWQTGYANARIDEEVLFPARLHESKERGSL